MLIPAICRLLGLPILDVQNRLPAFDQVTLLGATHLFSALCGVPHHMRNAAETANSAPALKGGDGATIAVEQWPIDKLIPYAANARAHPPKQIAQIAASIKEFGFNVPCLVDKLDVLIAGHGRVLGAKEAGLSTVPVIRLEHLTEAQVKAFRLADNKIALNADWLDDLLKDELSILQSLDFDLSLTGFGDDEIAALLGPEGLAVGDAKAASPKLADKFMVPPFSVLNAREGWWQERKRQWIALGIQSELGRGQDPGAGPLAKSYARTFGQDLMRGEHVVGGAT